MTPIVEPIALDEAFLDVSGAHRSFGSSEEIAKALRATVEDELSLQCGVGVGRSKLVAKLASKAAKPKVTEARVINGPGIVVVRPAEELAFLHAHAIRALPGVGPRTADRLARLGVKSVGDLAGIDASRLIRLFGKAHGQSLHDLSWARDPRPIVVGRTVRSIGQEETFEVDDDDLASLNSCVRRLAVRVASRCRSAQLCWKTVVLKVRFGDFTTVTRSHTGERATTAKELGEYACVLLASVDIAPGVRLIGVSVTGLEPLVGNGGVQLALFESLRTEGGLDRAAVLRQERLENTADEIRRRFGSEAIVSGRTSGPRESGQNGRR